MGEQEFVRVPTWKPHPKFVSWIHSYGIRRLSRKLNVDRASVQNWIRGKHAPREDYATALIWLSVDVRKLQERRLALPTLSYEDIYGYGRVRHGGRID